MIYQSLVPRNASTKHLGSGIVMEEGKESLPKRDIGELAVILCLLGINMYMHVITVNKIKRP